MGALILASLLIQKSSSAPGETDDQGYDEEDEEHPEQKLGSLHGEAGNPTETDRSRDQGHDKEYECVVQKVSHDHFLELVCEGRGTQPSLEA